MFDGEQGVVNFADALINTHHHTLGDSQGLIVAFPLALCLFPNYVLMKLPGGTSEEFVEIPALHTCQPE
jgi:hypothetical protein